MALIYKAENTRYYIVLTLFYFTHIYGDIGLLAICTAFWGDNMLYGVDKRPKQLKSGTVPVFKNKIQRQIPIALDNIVVQYHFAPHPPFQRQNDE